MANAPSGGAYDKTMNWGRMFIHIFALIIFLLLTGKNIVKMLWDVVVVNHFHDMDEVVPFWINNMLEDVFWWFENAGGLVVFMVLLYVFGLWITKKLKAKAAPKKKKKRYYEEEED